MKYEGTGQDTALRVAAAVILLVIVAVAWFSFRHEDEPQLRRVDEIDADSRTTPAPQHPLASSKEVTPPPIAQVDEPLEVRVVDIDGAAIAGATVSILSDEAAYVSAAGRLIPPTLTDAAGRCNVPFSRHAPRAAKIHAIASGYLPLTRAVVRGEAEIELVLAGAASLVVRLESTDGRVPYDATVTLSRNEIIPDDVFDDADAEISPLGTDEFPVHRRRIVEGRATFGSIEPGTWSISVESPRWCVAQWKKKSVAIVPGREVVVFGAEPVIEFVTVDGDRILAARCLDHDGFVGFGPEGTTRRPDFVFAAMRLMERWPGAHIRVDVPMKPSDDQREFHRIELTLARSGVHIVDVVPMPISELTDPYVVDATEFEEAPRGELVVEATDGDGRPTFFEGFVIKGSTPLSLLDTNTLGKGEPLSLPVGEYRLEASPLFGRDLFNPVKFAIVAGERTTVAARIPHEFRPLHVKFITADGRDVTRSAYSEITVAGRKTPPMLSNRRYGAPTWVPSEKPATITGTLADGRTCEEVVTVPQGEGPYEVVLTLR